MKVVIKISKPVMSSGIVDISFDGVDVDDCERLMQTSTQAAEAILASMRMRVEKELEPK